MMYRFREFTLDARHYRLTRDGQPQRVTPAVFRLLLFLVQNAGEIVTKETMLSQLWPDAAVQESTLPRHISVLRKLLGERPGQSRYIETIPKTGYRFVAEITDVTSSFRSCAGWTSRIATRPPRTVIGRHRERGRLRFAFHSAAAGAGSMIFISGEAATGKTSLVEDFLFEIGQTEGLCRIAQARCPETLSGTISVSPLIEAFTEFEEAPRHASELMTYIRNLSQAVPLVVFLDDLHWIDAVTARVLADVCTLFGTHQILIIGAYRPSELPPHHPLHDLTTALERAGSAHELRLLHPITSSTKLSDEIGLGT
jgi:DNA-binding winged helix-turn-helix (wHTH) protein